MKSYLEKLQRFSLVYCKKDSLVIFSNQVKDDIKRYTKDEMSKNIISPLKILNDIRDKTRGLYPDLQDVLNKKEQDLQKQNLIHTKSLI